MSALSLNSLEWVLMLAPYCRRILATPEKKGETDIEIEMREGGGKGEKGMEEMEVRRGEKKGRGEDVGERRR